MARVTRRKFLKVSGAGALAAKAGGMAGILATGRAPAYAQATTVHWLRWNDFVPASDQLLRKRDAARGREGAGHQDQLRDGQRQRPAAAHHLGDPVGRRSRPDHAQQQPSAALCRELRRHVGCRGAARQGRGRPLSARQGQLGRRQQVAVHAVGHHRRHDRLPQVVVRRGRRHHVPRHLGEVSRGRQEAQGQGPARSARRSATPSATRRPSPIPTCGRGAARRSRTTARRWSSTARRPSSPSSS